MLLRRLRESDLDQAWELDRECFNQPDERREFFVGTAAPEHLVGAFDGERLVALSRALPLAQYFGGRSVPMGGISSVATAPEYRGRGLGKRTVAGCIDLMRERGDAISTLFPATTDLYRQLGWEVAGSYLIRWIPPDALSGLAGAEGVRVRRGGPDDLPAIRSAYRRLAPQVNGLLDRPDSLWEAYVSQWKRCRVFVAEDTAGGVVGHLVYRQVAGEHGALGGPFQLVVEDHAALTRDAELALWRVLGSWSTMVDRIVYRGPAEDPLLLLLPQQALKVLAEVRWMTRMIDVTRAVERRGFAAGVDVEVHLALSDPLIEANRGRFVLRVAKGSGRLEPGGDGSIAMDVAHFAPLYTGWASTATLARLGSLRGGSDEERSRLDAAFAGPTPWILEQF
jgi:predicted acetyltransferase